MLLGEHEIYKSIYDKHKTSLQLAGVEKDDFVVSEREIFHCHILTFFQTFLHFAIQCTSSFEAPFLFLVRS
jgi:hypothetical protein